MKKLIAIILVLASVAAMGQDLKFELSAPIGLKFGSTYESAKQQIIQRGGKFDHQINGEEAYIFNNVKVGTRTADIATLAFVENKLYGVILEFRPTLEPGTQDLFNSIKNDLRNKYGDGICDRSFSGIYSDGDGYELQAIKLGYAKIQCIWDLFVNGSRVKLAINNSLGIDLIYTDGGLLRLVSKKAKEKDAGDL